MPSEQTPKKKIRVLIADQEGVFRLGLKKLFGLEDDLRVVAQAQGAAQVVVLAKEFRPDVVFFLTDGEVQNFTAAECAALNAGGKRVVINTIAFGDPTSQTLLKQIASDSGGVYRFVPSGAGDGH